MRIIEIPTHDDALPPIASRVFAVGAVALCLLVLLPPPPPDGTISARTRHVLLRVRAPAEPVHDRGGLFLRVARSTLAMRADAAPAQQEQIVNDEPELAPEADAIFRDFVGRPMWAGPLVIPDLSGLRPTQFPDDHLEPRGFAIETTAVEIGSFARDLEIAPSSLPPRAPPRAPRAPPLHVDGGGEIIACAFPRELELVRAWRERALPRVRECVAGQRARAALADAPFDGLLAFTARVDVDLSARARVAVRSSFHGDNGDALVACVERVIESVELPAPEGATASFEVALPAR